MIVSIRGEEQELRISTISLIPERDTSAMHRFLCTRCSTMVAQYQGEIAKMYPILEPYDRQLVISSCKNCNSKYTFQTHAGYDTGITRVILEKLPEPELNVFHCFNHRGRALLDYHDGVFILGRMRNLPTAVVCPICHQRYFIADMI